MMQQRVHQRAVGISGGRMHHQTGGLIDDQQMLILEDHPKRNVLGLVMGRRRLRDGEHECFPATDLQSGIADGSSRLGFQRPTADQRLEPFPRKGGDRIGKRTVQTPARMARREFDSDDLVAPHVGGYGSRCWIFNGYRSVAFWAQKGVTIDRFSDVPVKRSVKRIGLHEVDHREFVRGIDPEERRPRAIPEELADGTAVLFCRLRLGSADREVDAVH